MVARTPPPVVREKRTAEALNPAIIRDMMKKVDRCLARVEEMQHRVGGVRRSPKGRLQNLRDWHQISLPAMLVGETLLEIKQASQFAKQATALAADNPKTPLTNRRPNQQNDLLHRRNREKKWKSTATPPLRKKSRSLLFPSKSPEMARSRKRSPPHKFIVKARIRTNPPTPIRQQRPRSLSPVKMASKLVSPLKSRMTAAYNNTKQRRRSSIGTIVPPIVTKR